MQPFSNWSGQGLRHVAIATIVGMSWSFLGGCAKHSPGPAQRLVYVDVPALARSRPEWRGVDQLERQIAGLNAAAAAASKRIAITPPAGPTLSLPAIRQVAVNPFGPRASDVQAAVRASTPGANAIRDELRREAKGEIALFALNARRRYAGELAARKQAIQDQYASFRNAILRQYEQKIINLLLQRAVISMYVDQTQPETYLTPAASVNYQQARDRLKFLGSELELTLEDQKRAVIQNAAILAEEIRAADTWLNERVAEDVKKHTEESERRIAEQVQAAVRDMAQEAQERNRLFQNTFQNPLAKRLAPSTPSTGPHPVAGPVLELQGAVQAAINQQRELLESRRSLLARYLLEDTRSWTEAAAQKRSWRISYTRQPGAPDETRRMAIWLQERFLPTESPIQAVQTTSPPGRA